MDFYVDLPKAGNRFHVPTIYFEKFLRNITIHMILKMKISVRQGRTIIKEIISIETCTKVL